MRALLATDVQAAYDGADPAAASTDEIIFSYPGFFAIVVYRIAHELFKLEVPLIPRIMTISMRTISPASISIRVPPLANISLSITERAW